LLKAYGRALDMLKAKPAESAELIAKQVAATIDVVQADLGDCDFPPLKQQLMPAWLGTPGKVGKFSSVLKRWADFEVDQQLLRSEAPAFDKFIDTSVLQKAV
jgi:ABC-type nitrate/sulfonate/bicarbonate transport system substrate-binding protein